MSQRDANDEIQMYEDYERRLAATRESYSTDPSAQNQKMVSIREAGLVSIRGRIQKLADGGDELARAFIDFHPKG